MAPLNMGVNVPPVLVGVNMSPQLSHAVWKGERVASVQAHPTGNRALGGGYLFILCNSSLHRLHTS